MDVAFNTPLLRDIAEKYIIGYALDKGVDMDPDVLVLLIWRLFLNSQNQLSFAERIKFALTNNATDFSKLFYSYMKDQKDKIEKENLNDSQLQQNDDEAKDVQVLKRKRYVIMICGIGSNINHIDTLYKHFCKFGTIISIQRFPTKNVALIEFEKIKDAYIAICNKRKPFDAPGIKMGFLYNFKNEIKDFLQREESDLQKKKDEIMQHFNKL